MIRERKSNTRFPDENPVDALKRELLTLSVEDYMQTVKDLSLIHI